MQLDWTSLFSYQENNPLLFTQTRFWVLFGVVLLVYQVVFYQRNYRNFFLLGFSLYFYYLSSGYYFFLLLLSTFIDYNIGKRLFQSSERTKRRRLVALSVFLNLMLLGYFKYTFFISETFNQLFQTGYSPQNWLGHFLNVFGAEMDVQRIFLPVGISFYTFQTISYTVDIYRGNVKPVKSILDFAFFVSFFPQLVAGPIVRAAEFVPQIYKPFRLTYFEYGHAIYLILAGLFKKVFISDYISGNFVDRVFTDPMAYSGFENLMAVYGYSIQIYCDFSGYTDMAIGIALLLGFKLPLNFNSPYKAVSITDFWRRWHISLSAWLRDYLYISLGGNRKGKLHTYLNLMITMLLGGLWHGAHLRFILWGGIHGVALAVHKVWMEVTGRKAAGGNRMEKLWGGILTFHLVALAWIFFRAETFELAMMMIGQVLNDFDLTRMLDALVAYKSVFAVILLGFVVHLLPNRIKEQFRVQFIYFPDFVKATMALFLILLLFQIKSSAIQPFIYFQF